MMDISEILSNLDKEGHVFFPPAKNTDIELSEEKLKINFPKSYSYFLKEWSNGAILSGVQDIAGVGEKEEGMQLMPIHEIRNLVNNPEIGGDATSQDKIKLYNSDEYVLRKNLIPFSSDSNGNAWCFIIDNAPDNEYQIAYWCYHTDKIYHKLQNFTDWFSKSIECNEELIRVLSDEDLIYDELMLG